MTPVAETTSLLVNVWSDPHEVGIQHQIRGFIEGLIEEELAAALGRGRYQRGRSRPCNGGPGTSDTAPMDQPAKLSLGAQSALHGRRGQVRYGELVKWTGPVHFQDIADLFHQEERGVCNDNAVSFDRLKLQIEPRPLRHLVKATVRARR